MRKVTAGLFYSIDGAAQAPDQWQFDSFDDELGAFMTTTLANVDTIILGRVGYEEWSQYWPNAQADADFKAFINGTPKHVASTTLAGPLGWENASLISGRAEDLVRDLKAADGGDIAVMGGLTIVRTLFLAGLIDELALITHPVIAGSSYRRLFEGTDTVRLALVRAEITSKGNVVSTYRRAE